MSFASFEFEHHTEILIIGAGPAGLAAAKAALDTGREVTVIDDNFQSGGQIWRGGVQLQSDHRALALSEMLLASARLRCFFQSKLIHLSGQKGSFCAVIDHLQNTTPTCTRIIAQRIIVATGARELFLPFPGWTLPGVTGAGGLQALVKAGYPIKGKRVIVAGTGPLLLAVAASLVERGAIVSHIIEQTSTARLTKFAIQLFKTPSKLRQAIQLAWQLRRTAYWSDSYILEAHGKDHLENISISHQGHTQTIDCDYFACGFGLAPNLEVAASLGCEFKLVPHGDHFSIPHISVDEQQQSSVAGVFCAGETTGVGGVDLALAEGCIAGHAAALSLSSEHFSSSTTTNLLQDAINQREIWQRFAERLKQSFALRPEIRQLSRSDTIICRCEDVTFGQLQSYPDWRSAKLHTRCGMGACQGRICGNANRFLFGWERDVGRTPLQASPIHALLAIVDSKKPLG